MSPSDVSWSGLYRLSLLLLSVSYGRTIENDCRFDAAMALPGKCGSERESWLVCREATDGTTYVAVKVPELLDSKWHSCTGRTDGTSRSDDDGVERVESVLFLKWNSSMTKTEAIIIGRKTAASNKVKREDRMQQVQEIHPHV